MKKILAAIFLMLLISFPAFCGVTYWGMRAELWQKNNEFEKIVYVQGVFDGLVFADTTIHGAKLTTNISVVQYAKAIDALYSDYRNALIPVPYLMQVITLEIEGSSKELVEKLINEYRNLFSDI